MSGRPLSILSILPPRGEVPIDPAADLCTALRLRGHAVLTLEREQTSAKARSRTRLELDRIDVTAGAVNTAVGRVLRERAWDVVLDQWNHPLSVEWIAPARERGIPVVHRISDAAFCCDRRTLQHADTLPCHLGPETVEKCLRCVAPDWRDRGGDEAARTAAALATRRAVLRAAFDDADAIVFDSAELARRHRAVGFDHPRARTIRRGVRPFPLRPAEPAHAAARLRIGIIGEIDASAAGRAAWIETLVRLAELPVYLCIAVFDRSGLPDDVREELDRLSSRASDAEVIDVSTSADLGRALGRIDVLLSRPEGTRGPDLAEEARFAGVPALDMGRVREIALGGRPLPPTALSDVRLLDEQTHEMERLLHQLARHTQASEEESLETRRGNALVRCGRAADATPFFEAAHRAHPGAHTWLGLGVSAFASDDPTRAFEHLLRAHSLAPLDPDVVTSLAAAAPPERRRALGPAILRAHAANPRDPDLRRLADTVRGEP